MSKLIKHMLVERAEADALKKSAARIDQKWDGIAESTIAMIDRAAPFMDDGCDPTKWKPSEKLKLLYFVAASSPYDNAEKRAIQFILQMLDKGRKLWTEGLHPDPWADVPKVRP